jgi:hypothetical protein
MISKPFFEEVMELPRKVYVNPARGLKKIKIVSICFISQKGQLFWL